VSPLRALCIRNAYLEHKPETSHMSWKRASKLALFLDPKVEAVESDKNTLFTGEPLQSHEFRIMHRQHESTFPQCLGINRMWMEDALYPQYGDLKSAMFKQTHRRQPHLLRTKRAELLAKHRECKGVQEPQRPACKEIVEVVRFAQAAQDVEVAEIAEVAEFVEVTEVAEVAEAAKIAAAVETMNDKQETEMEQRIRAHLKEIEERKRIDREIRKGKKNKTFAWIQGIIGGNK
jgi:hypothetical protein